MIGVVGSWWSVAADVSRFASCHSSSLPKSAATHFSGRGRSVHRLTCGSSGSKCAQLANGFTRKWVAGFPFSG